MAKVLVRVQRSKNQWEIFLSRDFRHAAPNVIGTSKVEPEQDSTRTAEFFEVDERDAKVAVAEFAKVNPGCEVQVYAMTMAGVCPPGDLVLKEVTKDGVLPSI